MKYYSEETKKFYDCEIDLIVAEKELAEQKAKKEKEAKEKQENRKARAKEVEDAMNAMHEAQATYRKKLEDFVKDYGTYHYSTSWKDFPHLFDLFL